MELDRQLVSRLIVLTTLIQTALSFTFELPDREKTCFYQDFTGSARMTFSYAVIKGRAFDVDVVVLSPNEKVLYQAKKSKQNKVELDSSVGTMSFCFSNEFSTITHKTVQFNLEGEALETLAAEAGNTAPRVNTMMEESLEDIHRTATDIVKYQAEYRVNESRGRQAAELLNLGVQAWSIGQAVVILLSGFTQIVILKAFFTVKKKLPSGEEVVIAT